MKDDARLADVSLALGDAAWFAHRYDPKHDAVHFIRAPREAQRAATFLTDEYLPGTAQPLVIGREEAMAAAGPPGPIHFIFHSAFCCSTLLARAFDLPGVSMGLKEPTVLHDLVGWLRRGAGGTQVARILDDMLTLLARPLAPGEASIVKPSNLTNGFMRGILAMRPGARALLLHAPLSVYLGSVARKNMVGRLWARTLLLELARSGDMDALGFDAETLIGITDLQAAAVGWLAQHRQFAALAAAYPDRVRVLDSETLMEKPAEAMAAMVQLFALHLSETTVADIVASPAFSKHSKHGALFAATDRARERQDGAKIHAEEIERVLVWADEVAARAGVTLTLAPRLLP